MPIKTGTLTHHSARIARAMAHLAAHPDRTPSLEELADIAAFSPWHFHRAYRSLTGETPAETLARIRLSRAAAALIKSEAPLTRIAAQAGYGSVAAFTRAFREALGISPGAYRTRTAIGAAIPEEESMQEIIIVQTPAMHLAALPHRGSFDAMGPVFDQLSAWAGARGLITAETRFIGIYPDDPHSVPEAELRSQAALTVPPGTPLAPGMEVVELPALRCARLRYQGPYVELEAIYDRLYGEWLPQSGEEPGLYPVFEEYLNDCRSLPPSEWLTDILLPLRPRA
ncbi:AraC family transcriptional regulator [Sediminicoccus sp. KRV36]|uniref:AraC family transcriptional regulator n=1 Tax=Sediminicoccus sp. KRV36 TaxID=3133721 RepID=UPI00200C322A|nr:AraC family transcriptional regulator [Sediminicoccus rosea]UPY36431.1 AraC family transcriptional regulator [Sediminicoccus rosea]